MLFWGLFFLPLKGCVVVLLMHGRLISCNRNISNCSICMVNRANFENNPRKRNDFPI